MDVVKLACPVLSSARTAKTLFAVWKVTVPVGTPVPGALAVTVAVNVTG